MIEINNEYIKIDTEKTTLLLKRHEYNVEKVYYGKKIKTNENYDLLSRSIMDDKRGSMDDEVTYNTIFSFSGEGNNNESFVLLETENHLTTFRFKPIRFEIIDNFSFLGLPQARKKYKTIKIVYKDIKEEIYVNQYISIYNGQDVITFSSEVLNNSNKKISLKRLMSVQMDFHEGNTFIHSFDGAWLRERNLNITELKTGMFVIDSKSGHSSNLHNPFTILNVLTEGYFAYNLIYSGNHKTIASKSMFDTTRYLVGINDYAFNYEIEQGENFYSPEATVCFGESLEEITTRMHNFVNYAIIPNNYINKNRPILINNWEATYFDFNKQKILDIVNLASDVGIELFVLDDGWFGKRDDDKSSLGDWDDYVEKKLVD